MADSTTCAGSSVPLATADGRHACAMTFMNENTDLYIKKNNCKFRKEITNKERVSICGIYDVVIIK